MPTLRLLLLLPGLLTLLGTAVLATPVQYLETFETTSARDATATTALWDTVARELRIKSIPTTVVGGWDSPGGALSLAVAGNHAFLADGVEGLHIVDITDPENPSLVATFNTPGSANDVAIAGNYAFVADNTSGLRVIDISNPAAPVAAGAYDTPGSAYQVVIAGNYAYVADGSAGLRVVNISNPTAPVSAGTYDTTEARDLVVVGDDVFVADGSAGLRVLSVANPASPVLRATLDTPGTASGVAAWGYFLLLADGTAGIQVINILDPAAPFLVRTLDTPGTARNIAMDGHWAYLADVSAHVLVFEFDAVGGVIYQRDDCSIPGAAYNVVTAGGHAYVAAYSAGLQVLRISESCPPKPGDVTALTSIPLRIALDGSYAYVANGANGLRVLSLTTPDNPFLVGTFDTGNANGLDLEGDYAYVSDGTSGLKIVDISNPPAPELAGSYPATGNFYDVTVDGDYAYVANQSLGVRVLNVSNPAAPTLAGILATTGWAWTVAVDGDLAYVAEYDAGVRVLNVTNPAVPVSIGLCNTPGAVTDVAVHGDYVYAADGTAGLQVISVLNPASPYIVGACNTPGTARNVVLAGDVAYVADGTGGIQVIDIADPTNPVIVDAYDTDDSAYDVALAGDLAYVGRSTVGVQVFTIRDRILAFTRDRAQSVSLSQPGENLLKVRLSTVQAGSGSIDWQVNAVDPDGSPWQAINPDGAWQALTLAGDHLTWGCTLVPDVVVSPVCAQIAISWLAAPALIASVSDIPGDQGGRVRLAFARSAFDFADEPGAPITGYQVWRRVDDAQLKAALAGAEPDVATATGDLPLRRLHERSFHVAAPTFKSAGNPTGLAAAGVFPAGIWESMGTVLPVQQDQYLVPVATLADSAATIPWAVYCITAHTAMPSVWYASPPDSGWSVDNLAPAVPAGLHREPGDVLAWLASPATDFQYFSVYGSAIDHLDGSETLLEHTTGTSATIAGLTHAHYLVTATDCHGNESEAASLGALSDVPGAIPSALRLYPCQPNPFNPRTTIRFDLPTAGQARLSIYDLAGRLVRVLAEGERPAGSHEAVWDGRDAAGHSAPSGSYLARLVAGGKVEGVRLSLVR